MAFEVKRTKRGRENISKIQIFHFFFFFNFKSHPVSLAAGSTGLTWQVFITPLPAGTGAGQGSCCGAAHAVGLPVAEVGKVPGRGRSGHDTQRGSQSCRPQGPHCPAWRRLAGQGWKWELKHENDSSPRELCTPRHHSPDSRDSLAAPALAPLLPAACRPPWRRIWPVTAAACPPQGAPAAPRAPQGAGTAPSALLPPRSGAASRSPCAGAAGGSPGSGRGARAPSRQSRLGPGWWWPRGPSNTAALTGPKPPWWRRWGCPAPHHAQVGLR